MTGNVAVVKKQKGSYEAGKQRVADILEAAKRILIDGGVSQFTLRRVAEQAGLQLRHLQYYFKTKDKLLDALIKTVCDDYIESSQALVAEEGCNPEEKFKKNIDFLLKDNKDPNSNTLFFELWAMACHDDHVNQTMDELYIVYRKYIAVLISELHPKIAKRELDCRALQIVILIEGATLFIGKNKAPHWAKSGIENGLKQTILEIALAPA